MLPHTAIVTQIDVLCDHLTVAVSGTMRFVPQFPTPPQMPAEVRAIAEAIGHPMRTEILRQLSVRPQMARELAESTGTVLSQVRKHLAVLERLGLVAADRSPEQRGPGRGRGVIWTTSTDQAARAGRTWIDYVTGHHFSDTDPSN